MSRDDLSVRDRAVLFALLAGARKVSNPELKELIGFPLVGEDRRRLNDSKLVESDKAGRAFAHELSDKGWRWCADELGAGPEGRGSSLERAHYLVFGVFARYMKASGLTLADVVSADVAGVGHTASDADDATDVAARVEDGYLALAPAPGEFVKLSRLRLRLAAIPRPDVDSALAAMFGAQRINLIPQSNQQALSAADRESALRIGGEYKHLISIEQLSPGGATPRTPPVRPMTKIVILSGARYRAGPNRASNEYSRAHRNGRAHVQLDPRA